MQNIMLASVAGMLPSLKKKYKIVSSAPYELSENIWIFKYIRHDADPG